MHARTSYIVVTKFTTEEIKEALLHIMGRPAVKLSSVMMMSVLKVDPLLQKCARCHKPPGNYTIGAACMQELVI